MEFTVRKTDLVRELNLSQGVVEKKTTIQILSNVLLEARADHLYLTATDLELGVRCSCPAHVVKEGSSTLPVKRLLDFVRLLPDVDVNIKIQENHWASITCGRSRTRIAGMSKESFPELPAMPPVVAEIPASLLSSMIVRTIFAISVEESRFALNGALLLFRDGQAVMVATDGHRMAMVQNPNPAASSPSSYRTLVPKKAMSEILKLTQESPDELLVQFSGDENHLFFQFGERLLIGRKLTGVFPDYERVLPKDIGFNLLLSREEFRSVVERVGQFADERSHSIRLEVSSAELKLFSSISETGESEETIPIEYDGASVQVAFNAQYLLDFLRAIPDEQVSLLLKSSDSAGELRPGQASPEAQYRYVVMPMRI